MWEAVRAKGHVWHSRTGIKDCSLGRVRATTQSLSTHPHLHPLPSIFALTDDGATAILIMSSHSHTAGGASSDAIQLPPPPVPVFEMNQARRGKVVRELETLRSGTHACLKLYFKRSHVYTLSRTLIRLDHL